MKANHSIYAHFQDLQFVPHVKTRPCCDITLKNEGLDNFIQSLFHMDENGIIHDALGASLSDDIRPEVSEKIRKILMRPNKPIGTFNLSDDDLSTMSPNVDESFEDYAGRVTTFIRENQTIENKSD